MICRSSLAFVWAIVAVCAAGACQRSASDRRGGAIQVALHAPPGATTPASIVVTGLSDAELEACRRASLDDAAWEEFFAVTVTGASGATVPPVKGGYSVTADALQFTPLFPFDPGRSYQVRFDPKRIPQRARESEIVFATVALPAVATAPSVEVIGVHPSAHVLPENLLRMYVEFSGPMGSMPAQDFVRLIDRTGGKDEVVEGAFLPVEADFWSPDHRRYTLFFDPGRVKQGILPNRQTGRPLKAGRQYALEIASGWTDANRQPLVRSFRHEFTAAPVVESAIRLTTWKIEPPSAGTRDAVVVTFPRPLDHAVVMRALSIENDDGKKVTGTASIEAADTRWTFVPAEPWRPGEHRLAALSFLEDPQGNQINRPFEEAVDQPTPEKQPEVFRIVFGIQAKG